MKPRLLILCACLGGMAIWVAQKSSAPAADIPDEIEEVPQELKDSKVLLSQWPLPGEEPAVDAEFDVSVWLDDTDGKNRLYYSISEIHGYYVETLYVDFYYKRTLESTYEESETIIPTFINNYIKAGETLTYFVEVNPREIDTIYGDIGSTENWGAEVTEYNRAREKNPEVFRPVVRASSDD